MNLPWTCPLTGARTVPTHPGALIPAAIAYWEDVLMEQRHKRPRKPADRAAKEQLVAAASERLVRYRKERDVIAWTPKKVSKLTLHLAAEDLAAVMGGTERSAA